MDIWDRNAEAARRIKAGEFQKIPYGTTGTYCYFDPEKEKYYNDSGQELIPPEEYHRNFDSYFENQDYD